MARTRQFTATAEELRYLYVACGMSQADIAERFGVSQALVYLRLVEFNIKTRPNNGGRRFVDIEDRAELQHLYLNEKLSASQIAARLDCGKTTIIQNLHRYDLMVSADEKRSRRMTQNQAHYRRVLVKGYRLLRVPGHPRACNGYIAEHIVVVEKAMGRLVTSEERVHHINLQRRDNQVENLAVLPTVGDHSCVHKYMERVAAFLCGLTDIRPEPVDFGMPVFWGGEYVTSIDLIERARLRSPEARLSYDAPELAAVTVN